MYFSHPNCEVVEVDFLDKNPLGKVTAKIDAAYFLIHSMSSSSIEFEKLEQQIAFNFKNALEGRAVEHVVYLGGISCKADSSRHLKSRQKVYEILKDGDYNFTALGAGIIVGSGSSSFEIMRDLVEKLPIMTAPRWLLTKSSYISIRNVIQFLERILFFDEAYGKKYDIAGPRTLNYRQMLLAFARVRNLKRLIIPIPLLSPKLSSYWLYFVTSTSYNLAKSLVASMKVELIATPNNLHEQLGIELTTFEHAVKAAFEQIDQNEIISSWKDSKVSGRLVLPINSYINVPTHGCFFDKRIRRINNIENTMDKIWAIGGKTGWYYGTWLWEIRGFLDKVFGGVGLRRGRTDLIDINTGDALDFWRVILADKEEGRLLLYAEMKLPGEAWLEFKVLQGRLIQTATFRPQGVGGRLYWYLVLPFHSLIFNGMATKLAA